MTSSKSTPSVPKRRAQGSGTTVEVKPGVYRFRVFDGTRQVSRTVHTDGRAEAQRLHAKFVNDIAEQYHTGPSMTVAQLMAEFITHSQARGRSPKTVYEAERTVERIINPAVGSLSLDKLTTRHLDELCRKLCDEGKSPSSICRYHAVLSAALSQAVRWQWVAVNPAVAATLPTKPRPDLRAITVEDVGRLLAAAEAANPRFAMILKLGVLTGARCGELCALRWRDVDFDARFISIRTALYRAGNERGEKAPKSGRVTEVAIDDYGVRLLRDWRASYPVAGDDCFVVSSRPDGSEPVNPDTLSSFVNRQATKLGIRLEGRTPLATSP